MNNKITLASREDCTGCGACKEKCPKGAIVFRDDKEGFPTPSINFNKCIHCGKCERVCPALHKPETNAICAAYAAQLLDKKALMESTSGGLFTAFARWILRQNGVVYGCGWDKEYNALILKAETEEECKLMRGSKYVWSWGGDTFPEVRKNLEDGRIVMYTGLPCQIAGLKKYLDKSYDNLFLVSFLCGGSPSPLAFREYLKTIKKGLSLNDLEFKFRDKQELGAGVHITYKTRKGRVNQSYYYNPYYFSFFSKVINRRSCYHCNYRYGQRVEDVTMGDYWGIEKYHPDFDVYAGVSALLINSDRGKELLDGVKQDLRLSVTNVSNIAAWNNLTVSGKKIEYQVPYYRDGFFQLMKTKGWKAAERRYLLNKTRLKLFLKARLPQKYVSLLRKLILSGQDR